MPELTLEEQLEQTLAQINSTMDSDDVLLSSPVTAVEISISSENDNVEVFIPSVPDVLHLPPGRPQLFLMIPKEAAEFAASRNCFMFSGLTLSGALLTIVNGRCVWCHDKMGPEDLCLGCMNFLMCSVCRDVSRRRGIEHHTRYMCALYRKIRTYTRERFLLVQDLFPDIHLIFFKNATLTFC